MLSFYLRFVLLLSSIPHHIFTSVISIRNQCKSNWHYLSEDETCVIFATTQVGDVSWDNSSNACEASSAELMTLSGTNSIRSIEEKLQQNENYFSWIQRGSWIGEAKWSEDNLCDHTSDEDLQSNCLILTLRSDNQSLCLKQVSCLENHPFICQTRAMTEEEVEKNTMERFSFWKCLIPIWCAVDAVKESVEKKNREAAAAAAEAAKAQAAQAAAAAAAKVAAEIQGYKDKFILSGPVPAVVKTKETNLMGGGNAVPVAQSQSGIPTWLFMAGGGILILLLMCVCCIVIFCVYKKRKDQTREGSIDSTYSS